jgi:hypothetical protein
LSRNDEVDHDVGYQDSQIRKGSVKNTDYLLGYIESRIMGNPEYCEKHGESNQCEYTDGKPNVNSDDII